MRAEAEHAGMERVGEKSTSGRESKDEEEAWLGDGARQVQGGGTGGVRLRQLGERRHGSDGYGS